MASYQPSFTGCWAKVIRSKEQRDSLDAYIRETLKAKANCPRFLVKFESHTREYVFFLDYVPDLHGFFDAVSVRLGEIVHNLRSALDHLVFQLALWNTNGSVQKDWIVQFPITDNCGEFAKAKIKHLKEVHTKHAALIERFQGYHRIHSIRGSNPLAILRDFSNMDKHRLLLSVIIPWGAIEVSVNDQPILLMDAFRKMFFRKSLKLRPIKLGTEITRMKINNGMSEKEMYVTGYVIPQVMLSKRRPIITAVDRMQSVVVKLIRECEQLF